MGHFGHILWLHVLKEWLPSSADAGSNAWVKMGAGRGGWAAESPDSGPTLLSAIKHKKKLKVFSGTDSGFIVTLV